MPAMDDTEDLERRLRELHDLVTPSTYRGVTLEFPIHSFIKKFSVFIEAASALASARGRVAELEAALIRCVSASDQFVADTGLMHRDAITDATKEARHILGAKR